MIRFIINLFKRKKKKYYFEYITIKPKLKNYFSQMGIMRTFREHQLLVVYLCCIIAIVLHI